MACDWIQCVWEVGAHLKSSEILVRSLKIFTLYLLMYVLEAQRRTLRGQTGSFRDLWQNDDGTKS